MSDENEDHKTQVFNEACTKLQAYFGDFLVLVRFKNGYIMRRTNDAWATGAANGFLAHVAHEDRLEQEKKFFDEIEGTDNRDKREDD